VELGERIDERTAARARALADAWEVRGHGLAVPTYAATVVRFDPLRLRPADAESIVRELAAAPDADADQGGREVRVEVAYDGPDLEETAARSGVSVADLVELHASRTYRAFFLGFMPGFAYCGVLDARIVAPRLVRPRERVPAGTVAIADGQTSIYPFDSPGGWRLIGRTDARVFDPERDPPALISPGDRVRFVPK
jgi:KipI family sensor histidine kinase inhibitor